MVQDGDIYGYHKEYKNFNFFWILRAGHMVRAGGLRLGSEKRGEGEGRA